MKKHTEVAIYDGDMFSVPKVETLCHRCCNMRILLIAVTVLAFFSSCAPQWQDIYIETRCIDGHLYYFNIGFNAGGIAPKLNDDGTPCKCQPKENY